MNKPGHIARCTTDFFNSHPQLDALHDAFLPLALFAFLALFLFVADRQAKRLPL